MKLYRDPLYFMLYEKIGNQDLAKDLTIEALGKAFKKLNLYVPDYAFSTWLFTIARNNCIDYLRKYKLPTISIDEITIDDDGEINTFDIFCLDQLSIRIFIEKNIPFTNITIQPIFN